MSTRATIYYSEKYGIHIYEELLEGDIYLEIHRDGLDMTINLMPNEEWLLLGLLQDKDDSQPGT